MLDITETTAPKSDQQNFEDYVGGPKTVTISEVRKGSADQPVEVHLVEFPGRPFKPSKTVRRILVAAWGPDASQYAGRRMTLFGDPTVKWAGQAVGGIRVSHLSHLDKPLSLMLAESKGKRTQHTVQPLKESAPAPDYSQQIDAAPDVDSLRALWSQIRDAGHMTDALDKAIKARVESLSSAPESGVGADAEGVQA